MKTEELWLSIEKAIDGKASEAIALSDALAAAPEVSGQEREASKAHVTFLRSCGYDVTHPFMDIETAFCARRGKAPRPRVALLFEYDALPGIGHGCGHNVSGAMSGLAAAGLAAVADDLPGELLLVGTPAEETNGAKVTLAEKGFFDETDLALMIHSSDRQSYVGYRSLAMDALEFRFTGKPAHAAAEPWAGLNALNAVQLLFHAIDMLRQHVRPETRMHGIIAEGGLAPNIVPERAVARFYFRAPRRSHLDGIIGQVQRCAEGAALATGTKVTWHNFEFSFDDMLKNDSAETFMEGLFADFGITTVPSPGRDGSSDMGNVSQRCPSLQPKLSIVDEAMALHTHEFAQATTQPRAHEALVTGAKILARATLLFMADETLRQAIRADFDRERQRP